MQVKLIASTIAAGEAREHLRVYLDFLASLMAAGSFFSLTSASASTCSSAAAPMKAAKGLGAIHGRLRVPSAFLPYK